MNTKSMADQSSVAFHGCCALEQINAPVCFRIQGVEIKKVSHLSSILAAI